MSLINDALKRVKQAGQQNPFGGGPTEPLRPVNYSDQPDYFRRVMLASCVVLALIFSVWCFRKWLGHKTAAYAQEKSRVSTPSRQVIHVSTNIVVRTNFGAVPKPEPTKPELTNAAAPLSPTNAPASDSTPEPAHPQSPFADLKLQSIVFREDKPAAVINGEMLFVGDEIKKARVTSIDRQSVVVERDGQTNELRLPRL